jgi:glycosyltransferase involved in cell wall biosynthesis/nucleotide-binding universal stress UspA family protein
MNSRREPCRIAVVGTSYDEIARVLPFARVLAQARGDQKLIVGLVAVPEGESLSRGANAAQVLRKQLEPLPQLRETRVVVRVAHSLAQEVRAVVAAEACSLLLLPWGGALVDELVREPPCDVVIANGELMMQTRRILLPIRGGRYAALALQIARAFAQVCHSEITLLHAAPPARFRDEVFREFFDHLQSLPEITRWIKVKGDVVDEIKTLARAREEDTADAHQLLVMGAIAKPQRDDPPIGPTATRAVTSVAVPALIVKTMRALTEPKPLNGKGATLAVPVVDYTISVVVDKWFAENTFAAHEFQDLKRLVEKKERQGLTISLGLPTLNEEETIGKVIKTIRHAFMQKVPLLDEIVVIDSNSTDRTVEIAADLNVPVVRHPEILTQYQVYEGKGEALWNSLYVLKGDLIAWIDTDIINIHPRFVYGILGPLIQEPRLMYVKGFYQRPLRVGRQLVAQGGGRVTELVARPLLNLFYPELSGMIQPLAGEYAGRRAALEAVPFFTGYGVETGLLIDILTRYGLSAIGQVDLEERVHRNQSLLALSKMAYAIIQVVMKRVGDQRGVEFLNAMNASMKLIHNVGAEYCLDIVQIRDHERPPIVTLPEYRQARAALSARAA